MGSLVWVIENRKYKNLSTFSSNTGDAPAFSKLINNSCTRPVMEEKRNKIKDKSFKINDQLNSTDTTRFGNILKLDDLCKVVGIDKK